MHPHIFHRSVSMLTLQVDLTENGSQILKNFLYSICELKGTFTMNTRKQAAIDMIRRHVGYAEGDDSNSESAKKVRGGLRDTPPPDS